jgi:hypothetical protein
MDAAIIGPINDSLRFGLSLLSFPRTREPITTGRCYLKKVFPPTCLDATLRGMGPRVRGDDEEAPIPN